MGKGRGGGERQAAAASGSGGGRQEYQGCGASRMPCNHHGMKTTCSGPVGRWALPLAQAAESRFGCSLAAVPAPTYVL